MAPQAKSQTVVIGGVSYSAEEAARLIQAAKMAEANAEAKALAKSAGINDLALAPGGDGLISFTMAGTMLRQPSEGESKREEGVIRKSLTGGRGLTGHIVVDGAVYTVLMTVRDYRGKAEPESVLAVLK